MIDSQFNSSSSYSDADHAINKAVMEFELLSIN